MKTLIPTVLALSVALCPIVASAQNSLPTNANSSVCFITANEFSSWFASGSVSRDGLVNPADSVNFPINNTVCDFYKWSSRMFLWLTSPSAQYGGEGFVFDSPTFYDVSAANSVYERTLIPNAPGVPNLFPIRLLKPEDIPETGQARGGGVLLSQGESLVYYGIHVNDVYAYFLSAQKGHKIDADEFPNTQADLDAVIAYAGRPLADANALTMELKTAWVDASTLDDASQYLTIEATVAAFTKKSNLLWVANGTETKELALIGMHVVGTVQNHPEMVWATFEHLNNAPFGTYNYTDTAGSVVTVPYDSSGDWTLMAAGGTKSSANKERMNFESKTGNIAAHSGETIGSSNTYQVNSWGSVSTAENATDNNTQLISLNSDVLGFLDSGDVRKNYLLTGAIWTQNGKVPHQAGYVEKGSLSLANTTMETYHQDLNCFFCHSGTDKLNDLSHIYEEIQPLKNL